MLIMFVRTLLRFANDFLIFTVKTNNFFENLGVISKISGTKAKKKNKKTDNSKISFMGWVTFSFMEIFYKSPPPSKLQKMAEGGGFVVIPPDSCFR